MISITVVIKGLCLWLTAGATTDGLPGIVPDFSKAVPPHYATLTVGEGQIVGTGCPNGFVHTAGGCSFTLNRAGLPGGVEVSFIGDEPSGMPDSTYVVSALPKIVAGTPLVLKPQYTPGVGADIAAQVVIDQGVARSMWSTSCSMSGADCPRFIIWTVTSANGHMKLALSNLLPEGKAPIVVELKPGALVTLDNSPHTAALKKKTARRGRHAHTETGDGKDWCLYFKMFEGDPPCLRPAPPECPLCVTDERKPPDTQGDYHTIACSNSTYP